jgi:hypothetical protein
LEVVLPRARFVLRAKPSPHGQEHLRRIFCFALIIIVGAKSCSS